MAKCKPLFEKKPEVIFVDFSLVGTWHELPYVKYHAQILIINSTTIYHGSRIYN